MVREAGTAKEGGFGSQEDSMRFLMDRVVPGESLQEGNLGSALGKPFLMGQEDSEFGKKT